MVKSGLCQLDEDVNVTFGFGTIMDAGTEEPNPIDGEIALELLGIFSQAVSFRLCRGRGWGRLVGSSVFGRFP